MITVSNITPTLIYKYLGASLQKNGKFGKEYTVISNHIQNFNKYYLLNKAQLGTLTTKIFLGTYI